MSTPLANNSELALPSDGADDDVWGLENNALHSAWDRFLGGWVNHDMSASDWVLTDEEAQEGRIWITGTSAVARSVVLPANKRRTWIVLNLVQGAGTFMQIAQPGTAEPINLPQNTIAVVFAVPGAIGFASPPVDYHTGGFLPALVQPGFGYFGPSLFFSNREVGFGSPAAGYLAMFLAAGSANAELRFQFNNSAANPMIAALRSGGIWDTGLYFPGGGEVHVAALGQHVAAFRTSGVSVGGGNGSTGPGTINASQYYRAGVAMPFQYPVQQTYGLGAFQAVPHGVGGPPLGVFGKLRCVAGDLGYNPGDLTDAAVAVGLAYGADANNGFCCASGAMTLPRKGTGAQETAIKGRWNLDLLLTWP
jgi:hypothetical protein